MIIMLILAVISTYSLFRLNESFACSYELNTMFCTCSNTWYLVQVFWGNRFSKWCKKASAWSIRGKKGISVQFVLARRRASRRLFSCQPTCALTHAPTDRASISLSHGISGRRRDVHSASMGQPTRPPTRLFRVSPSFAPGSYRKCSFLLQIFCVDAPLDDRPCSTFVLLFPVGVSIGILPARRRHNQRASTWGLLGHFLLHGSISSLQIRPVPELKWFLGFILVQNSALVYF